MNPVSQKNIGKTFSRPTWAEIKLDAITENIKKIRSNLNRRVKILAVIKADAYGHGMIEVTEKILPLIDYLGVATVDEGVLLREKGIKRPILVMGSVLSQEAEKIVSFNLTPTVFTNELAYKLNEEAGKQKKEINIHIKVDTGMGRIGVWFEEGFDFINQINKLENLKMEGIYTHFPSAEGDNKFTLKQVDRFNFVLKKLKSKNIDILFKHACNSSATVKFKQAHFNLIRPGLMMYGVYPSLDLKSKINLNPALSLKSKITYIKEVPSGRSISYGRTFFTKRKSLIGTIPIGYADGYPHVLSNKAKLLVREKIVPVVGRICMDQLMVDLTDLKEVEEGDEVVLIGNQGEKQIKVEELAKQANTIPYEILCLVSTRVPRVFKEL